MPKYSTAQVFGQCTIYANICGFETKPACFKLLRQVLFVKECTGKSVRKPVKTLDGNRVLILWTSSVTVHFFDDSLRITVETIINTIDR